MHPAPPYPLLLQPRLRELIWGGHALVERFHKAGDPHATIGESWECYDGNAVLNGALSGRSIAEVRETLGSALTGHLDPHEPFPLLTKLIDARAALSVQVHPTDAYARAHEREPNGKTECWHVLEADPGASIVLGWRRDTTRAEFSERVADGTLGVLLRSLPVKPGDTFYLPAGTLHAIGAGIVLFEVQQTSDLTYRIFDYDRIEPGGAKRTLQVEKAADVLDFHESHANALATVTYEAEGLKRTTLVADSHFTLERVEVTDRARSLPLDGGPLVVFALGEPVELEARGERVHLAPYVSALVPAGMEAVRVRASATADLPVLLTVAPPNRDALERRLQSAGVAPNVAKNFFGQFA